MSIRFVELLLRFSGGERGDVCSDRIGYKKAAALRMLRALSKLDILQCVAMVKHGAISC